LTARNGNPSPTGLKTAACGAAPQFYPAALGVATRFVIQPDADALGGWPGHITDRPISARPSKRGEAVFLVLRMLLAKIEHELPQGLDSFEGHGIVDRGATSAHGAMALQVAKLVSFGLLEKLRLQFGTGQAEDHVHYRAAFRSGMALVEAV